MTDTLGTRDDASSAASFNDAMGVGTGDLTGVRHASEDGVKLSLNGVDHTARPTWKLNETVEFYRDILGLPLVHAISARGWGPPRPPGRKGWGRTGTGRLPVPLRPGHRPGKLDPAPARPAALQPVRPDPHKLDRGGDGSGRPIPDRADPALAKTVRAFREDELGHKRAAEDHGAEDAPGFPVMRALIGAGCRLAIRLSEKI